MPAAFHFLGRDADQERVMHIYREIQQAPVQNPPDLINEARAGRVIDDVVAHTISMKHHRMAVFPHRRNRRREFGSWKKPFGIDARGRTHAKPVAIPKTARGLASDIKDLIRSLEAYRRAFAEPVRAARNEPNQFRFRSR